jgi:hypothetical protein
MQFRKIRFLQFIPVRNAGQSSTRIALGAYFGILGMACTAQQRPITPPVEGQTYAEAIQLLCEVDARVGAPEGTSELELGQLREDYIVENTKHPDAIFFTTVWRTKSPSEQAALLKREALGQKITDCKLVQRLETSTD